MKPIDWFKMGMQILTVISTFMVGFGRMEAKIDALQHDVYLLQTQQTKWVHRAD